METKWYSKTAVYVLKERLSEGPEGPTYIEGRIVGKHMILGLAVDIRVAKNTGPLNTRARPARVQV